MRRLFASDLHLSASSPEKISLFTSLLERAAQTVDSLYLLGDVFEIWLGDDDDTAPNPSIVDSLRRFTESSGTLYVMSGNRDFLFGSSFAQASGATLLDDWHIVELGGVRTLLTHGDLLCTKDVQYQEFRKHVRDPKTQAEFIALPLNQRRAVAAKMRSGTQASMLEKDEFIMDVEQSTVERVMQEHDVKRLIHGHTHRPANHTFEVLGQTHERIVLGDWYGDECSVVVSGDGGLKRLNANAFANS